MYIPTGILQTEFVFTDFVQWVERHFNGDDDQIVMLSMWT
jgi:hypothetical protein